VSTRTLARRLLAHRDAAALPQGSTLHLPIAPSRQILMLAFVRMGGESSPWAIAHGRPGGGRTVLSVAEPRNRDLVAHMAAQFSGVLLREIQAAAAAERLDDFHQVWVPNDSHIEMLHFLAYRYVWAKRADPEILGALNVLGRAASALHQESQRPGQTFLLSATSVLREAYTFPSDDVRQNHLGFLVPWLDHASDASQRRQKAAEAERLSISTSLDPLVEAEELASAVEGWNEAQRSESGSEGTAAHKRRIGEVLSRELNRRLDTLEAALTALRRDTRALNAGVAHFVQTTIRRLGDELPAIEHGTHDDGRRRYAVSPDTDHHPRVAAAKYFELEEAHDEWISLLLHDDAEMQSDAVADGDAFAGVITDVVDEGTPKKREPVWFVDSDGSGPLRLREGTQVCVAGCPKRIGRIRRITDRSTGGRTFEVEMTGAKRAFDGGPTSHVPSHDTSLVGSALVFVQVYPSEIHQMKRRAIWRQDAPGDWVHRLGRPVEVPGDEDAP
jgi:hypothetical protein